MIRINLLPQKRVLKGRSAAAVPEVGSQMWLLGVLGALIVECVILIFVYKHKQDQLGLVERKNEELKGTIGQIQKDMSNHDQIKTSLKDLRDREDAIQKLQSARTGPTSTLLELSRILSAGRGPTVDRDKVENLRRDNPLAVPNPNWDTKRLWLTNYLEADRVVKLQGMARDGEDVSELLRRLQLSDYFYDVRLLTGQKQMDTVTKVELVKFEMSGKVKY